MPQIIPKVVIGSEDFEAAINYHLHYDDDFFKLAQKFVTGQIEANPTMSRPELRKLIESKSTQFILSVKYILDELF